MQKISVCRKGFYLSQIQKADTLTAQNSKLKWGFIATRKQMRDHGWDYYYGYLDHVIVVMGFILLFYLIMEYRSY